MLTQLGARDRPGQEGALRIGVLRRPLPGQEGIQTPEQVPLGARTRTGLPGRSQ